MPLADAVLPIALFQPAFYEAMRETILAYFDRMDPQAIAGVERRWLANRPRNIVVDDPRKPRAVVNGPEA